MKRLTPEETAVLVRNLKKEYRGNKVAVADVNFHVKDKQCFGLLGLKPICTGAREEQG